MGTHPIFESDFDCLTAMLFRVLGVLHQRHLSRSTHHLKKSMSQRCCWEWEKCIPPPPGPVAELKLNNSFTRKKDLFKPLQDNTIHWYSCGPTVYDKSHMGHARGYVSFDIIRKILKGYFGYNVFLQMNITDIDDKIIRRARQNHLFDNWKKASPQKDDIVDLATKGIERFQSKHDKEEDADKKKMYADHLTKARAALDAFESPEAVFDACVDSMSDHLDAEKGSTVTDNSIFETLPRYWEGKYFEDMAALKMDMPTRAMDPSTLPLLIMTRRKTTTMQNLCPKPSATRTPSPPASQKAREPLPRIRLAKNAPIPILPCGKRQNLASRLGSRPGAHRV